MTAKKSRTQIASAVSLALLAVGLGFFGWRRFNAGK